MITARQAAEVARRHGLSLSDAAALAKLAATPEEADALAGMFTGKAEAHEMPDDGLLAKLEAAVGLRPKVLSEDDIRLQVMQSLDADGGNR